MSQETSVSPFVFVEVQRGQEFISQTNPTHNSNQLNIRRLVTTIVSKFAGFIFGVWNLISQSSPP